MLKFLRYFARDSSGAVTVDWVVLAAAAVGFGYMATSGIASGTATLGESFGTFLATDPAFAQNK